MSDPVVQPGAAAAGEVPQPSKGVISKDVSIQRNLISLTAQAENAVLRLNKVLAAPGGLSSLLSTTNYALYLIAHLQTKTPSLSYLSQLFLHTLNYNRPHPVSKPPPTPSTVAAVSPLLNLASLISKTRTNLRLAGLPAVYTALRSLLTKPLTATDDALIHRITVTQCLGYLVFQFLENISVLVEAGVLPKTIFDRLSPTGKGDQGKAMLWACRAWLVGVSCDFLRVLRQATLIQQRRRAAETTEGQADARANVEKAGKKERDEEDAKWWRELIVPLSWLPVAIHYSVEGGLPGMNLGVIGFCGVMAGLGKTQEFWSATK